MRLSKQFRAAWLGASAALWLLSGCASENGGSADDLGLDDGGGDSAVAVTSQPLTGNGTYNALYKVAAVDVCLGGTSDSGSLHQRTPTAQAVALAGSAPNVASAAPTPTPGATTIRLASEPAPAVTTKASSCGTAPPLPRAFRSAWRTTPP